MKILIIGGSYFLGRFFVELAKDDNELTLFNRGNIPLRMEGIKEIKGDRSVDSDIASIEGDFDVIVDFCAYAEGDIKRILDNIKGTFKRYVFISTEDVYKRVGSSVLKKEDFQYEDIIYEGEAGNYISGKIALEKELISLASERNFEYTIFRPAIIYGPLDYSGRLKIFIDPVLELNQVIKIVGTTGEFQLVYVSDVARIIISSLSEEKAANEIFNITSDEILTYDLLADEILGCFEELKQISPIVTELTEEYAESVGFNLPFAVHESETELIDNEKSVNLLNANYLSFTDCLRKMIKIL